MLTTKAYLIEDYIIHSNTLYEYAYEGELFGSVIVLKFKDIVNIIKHYISFPMSKLDKYMQVNDSKLELAYKEYDGETIDDLLVRREIILCAIEYKKFDHSNGNKKSIVDYAYDIENMINIIKKRY